MNHGSRHVRLIAVALAVLGARAPAQDVLTSYRLSSLRFQDAVSLVERGDLNVLQTDPVLCLAHAGGGIFFGIQGLGSDGQPDLLVRIDAHAGTRTVVGSIGLDFDRKGIDIDPTTGFAYVMTGPAIPFLSLYRVDLVTGVLTLIGPQSPPGVFATTFAIDPAGRAIVLTTTGQTGQLHFRAFEVALTTGQFTLVGDFPEFLPLSAGSLGDASFRSDGKLLVDAGGSLHELDVSTLHSMLRSSWNHGALACAPAGDVGLANTESCSGYPFGCPCISTGGRPGNGCSNSGSLDGSNLRVYGTASLANDSVSLVALGMPSSSGLFFQGSVLISPALFGDGLRCASGALHRLGGGAIQNGALSYPAGPQAPVSVHGQIGAPGTFHYQCIFRDNMPYCTADAFNLTNSVSVVWTP
jgi:hypothetical protein